MPEEIIKKKRPPFQDEKNKDDEGKQKNYEEIDDVVDDLEDILDEAQKRKRKKRKGAQ